MAQTKPTAPCRARVGFVATESAYPPHGGPSVHIFQVWHRLRRMGYEIHTWGEQAIPDSLRYPRTPEGMADLLDHVDLLYWRLPVGPDWPWTFLAAILRRRMPIVAEFNAPLEERTLEWPGWQPWAVRRKLGFCARNHLIVRSRVCHTITVSRIMADYLRRAFGVDRLTLLPNGGDPELFTPARRAEGRRALGVRDEDFVLFWGGSTVYFWQGLSQVMAAAQQLNHERVRVVIAGDKRHLPNPLPRHVIALGSVNYFDMPQYVAGSDACLCLYNNYDWCSIGFYNSPLKLFDYMASGRPSIASNMGQIAEVIRDGENGYLTDGTPADLARKIQYLWEHREARERVGRAARDTIVCRYNWETVAERTAAILEAVLRDKGGGPAD